MIIKKDALDALFTGLSSVFNDAFSTTESYLDKLASVAPSLSREEDYCWLGAFPGMREWIGQREVNNPEAFNYAIKNRTFESTFSVSREDIEDDKIGVFKPITQQLGELSKTHPDELLFGLLKDGFSKPRVGRES